MREVFKVVEENNALYWLVRINRYVYWCEENVMTRLREEYGKGYGVLKILLSSETESQLKKLDIEDVWTSIRRTVAGWW